MILRHQKDNVSQAEVGQTAMLLCRWGLLGGMFTKDLKKRLSQ